MPLPSELTQPVSTASPAVSYRSPHLHNLFLRGVIFFLLVLMAADVAVQQASAGEILPSSYSVNRGKEFTAKYWVSVGDRGSSPFFRRGVIVWDGGSILGGYPDSSRLYVANQTVQLLSQVVGNSMSITGNAKILDMLAEAPAEVDARQVADADANVCVIMGGAPELKKAVSPEETRDLLRQYCLDRRAAGFQVVVVTLLPCASPEGFEARRLAFNELVRSSWTEFADGLADVGADRRIGDTYDNLDPRYFRSDHVHPNAAGYNAMATVLAPALRGLLWRSDTCALRLRNASGAWTEWHDYVPLTNWLLEAGDGVKTVEAEYRDGEGTTVALADSIALDTVRPLTTALRAVQVPRGRTVRLGYRVDDPAPGSPRAKVTIHIKSSSGVVIKRLYPYWQPVGVNRYASFACRLPRGTYRYVVYARDAADNRQSRAGSATLTVF